MLIDTAKKKVNKLTKKDINFWVGSSDVHKNASRKGPYSDCELFKKNQVYKCFCDQCFMQF